jgi:hypothetical protein
VNPPARELLQAARDVGELRHPIGGQRQSLDTIEVGATRVRLVQLAERTRRRGPRLVLRVRVVDSASFLVLAQADRRGRDLVAAAPILGIGHPGMVSGELDAKRGRVCH